MTDAAAESTTAKTPGLKTTASPRNPSLVGRRFESYDNNPIPSPPRIATPTGRQPSDASSDKATAAFIRRTLCAHQLHNSNATMDATRADRPALDALLPPLTSSNEVDLQLYAIIAIIINESVYPWYARVTNDHVFVDEVVQTIAHCTRALEERMRKLDVEALLLDDIPKLLDAHVNACRTAQEAVLASGPPVNARVVYHTLRPHPALSPVPDESDPVTVLEQQQNDAAYRNLLAQGVIAVLLPTEDLRNPCLRSLVSEIFADLILGNFLSGRLCDPLFIHECTRKAAETLRPRTGVERWAIDGSAEPKNRLARYGLLAEKGTSQVTGDSTRTNVLDWFWTTAQYVYLTFSALRLLVKVLTADVAPKSMSGTAAPSMAAGGPASDSSTTNAKSTLLEPSVSAPSNKPAILELCVWPTIANVIDLPSHMPWLCGCIALAQHFLLHGAGRVGGANSRLDR